MGNRIRIGILGLSLLCASMVQAATYYASPNGSGGCSTNKSAPGKVQDSVGCLKSGDTLLLAGGSYKTCLRGFASGSSWQQAVTMAGEPGAQALFNPASCGQAALFEIQNTRYLIIDNITIDAKDFAKDGTNNAVKIMESADHIRISNSVIKNARGLTDPSATKGILSVSPGSNQFLNLEISGNLGYGIYLYGAGNLIEGCNIHDNNRYGLHLYSDDGGVNDNVVRNNRIANNGENSAGCWAGCYHGGMVMASGRNNMAYNNIITGNANGGIDLNSDDSAAYNNTLYGNKREGAIRINGGNAQVKNNIVYGNDKGIEDQAGASVSKNLTSDPKFVNASAGDFRLQQGSPAVGAGDNLSSIFKTDLALTVRPGSGAWTIGAYEGAGGPAGPPSGGGGGGGTAGPPPAAPTNLRLITTP